MKQNVLVVINGYHILKREEKYIGELRRKQKMKCKICKQERENFVWIKKEETMHELDTCVRCALKKC